MPSSSDFNRFAVNQTDIDISRSYFDLPHSVKFSCNIGEVIPFDVIECLPGDTWNIDTAKIVRTQPLVAPIMDEILLDTYYFFVPNRLIWSHWVNFQGENTESPFTPATEYTIPQTTFPSGGWETGTIADYMGIPVGVESPDSVSSLPFRAYALICDQWFRSEALMNPVNVSLGDSDTAGSNTSDQTVDIEKGGKPFIAAKLFDYFTACLPEPQRGDAPPLSLSGLAPVFARAGSDLDFPGVIDNSYEALSLDRLAEDPDIGAMNFYRFRYNDDGTKTAYTLPTNTTDVLTPLTYRSYHMGTTPGVDNYTGLVIPSNQKSFDDKFVSYYSTPNNLWADLGAGINFSVNDLRISFAVQRYLEKLARAGGRYTSVLSALWNVESPDSRLQRTEYLGGSRISLDVDQIAQTSETGLTPQGNPVGLSITGDYTSDVNYSCTEHGYLIGVCVARHKRSYQQGLNRMWSRKSLYDFYMPAFANLGEMPIKNKEIYLTDDPEDNNLTFGFQEAWADYRHIPNRIAGEMRSTYSTPLDMWHLGDYYANMPFLSDDWLRESKEELDRCLAVTSSVSNQLIIDLYIDAKAARPMPLYSIPGLIDHN